MLAGNLQSGSFHDAITKTFDGRHPCCLCKAIAAAKKSEKKSKAAALTPKLEFPPATARVALYLPSQFRLLPLQDCFAASLSVKPPVPPPRAFFV